MNDRSTRHTLLRDTAHRVHIRARDAGAGLPSLILLHYFGGSGRSWLPTTRLLARGGFGCIAPDLRGFGEFRPAQHSACDYTLETWADDIAELVRLLDLKRFAIVGHSMGGKIALALAARNLIGLEAVILLAPSPPTPEPMPEKERTRLLQSYGDPVAARKTLRKIAAKPLSRARMAAALQDNLRTAPAAWHAWLEHGSREDISPSLRRVQVPVSIAIGSSDETITAPLMEREIAGRLHVPVSIRVIKGAGHLLPLENPRATAKFIAQHSEGERSSQRRPASPGSFALPSATTG